MGRLRTVQRWKDPSAASVGRAGSGAGREAALPALPGEGFLAPLLERLGEMGGHRLISVRRSGLPRGIIVTHSFPLLLFQLGGDGSTFTNFERMHLFVAGGRWTKVLTDAAAEAWAGPGLLRLAEGIEEDIARENA